MAKTRRVYASSVVCEAPPNTTQETRSRRHGGPSFFGCRAGVGEMQEIWCPQELTAACELLDSLHNPERAPFAAPDRRSELGPRARNHSSRLALGRFSARERRRTIRRCTPSLAATPLMLPTPNSYPGGSARTAPLSLSSPSRPPAHQPGCSGLRRWANLQHRSGPFHSIEITGHRADYASAHCVFKPFLFRARDSGYLSSSSIPKYCFTSSSLTSRIRASTSDLS